MTDPKLTLTFTANDLPSGHSTTQVLNDDDLVRDSFESKRSRINGLKSSSDTVNLQIRKGCASVEDIIATEGNIQAVLADGETTLFTGFIATSYSWGVTDHGEQALNVTLESQGTRLFNKPFIETGKHFFDCTASAAVEAIITPLGLTMRSGDASKLPQNVKKTVEAGETCRELLDALFYECNCVYYFNAIGQLCVQEIEADTDGAPTYNKNTLRMVDKKVVTLSKKLRTYSGARVAYTELASADNYLVYRNTTGQDSEHPYCNLELQAGEYFDGTEIYTAAEWSEAQADTFREPALIGAVNAASESQVVGSNKIVSISNLSPDVVGAGMTCVFENVGGGYFKLTAHNESGGARSFTKMDLKASIVYVKSNGVIRTQIDGPSAGKSVLEEELSWIHDKDDATKHANLLAQYHRYASASYTFYTNEDISLGSVVRLNDDVFSGLDVFVLVTASQKSDNSPVIAYSAVGVSTFDLDEDAYHGVSQQAKQSGAMGPAGPKGDSVVVEYALGSYKEPIYPPSEDMTWEGETMTWDEEAMQWGLPPWSTEMPVPVRGMCVWMRTKVGTGPWEISRLTGLMAWEPQCVGVCTDATPTATESGEGLIIGDYFVAGETFTEDGKTYTEGFVYEYDGVYWHTMNIGDPANMSAALNSANAVIQNGTNVSNYTSSIYGWFKNLVAQNGVFANLLARNLQVGEGDGTAGSGFRFRAREYNSSGQKLTSPDFDVYYNDNMLFSVDSDGKIFFGQGFWYDPTDLSIHSQGDNVVIDSSGSIAAKNATLNGDSYFEGSFDCGVIKTAVSDPQPLDTFQTTENGYKQTYNIWSLMGSRGYAQEKYYPATITGIPSVKYVRRWSTSRTDGFTHYTYTYIGLYDENFTQIKVGDVMSVSKPAQKVLYSITDNFQQASDGNYALNGYTLVMLGGGNALQLDIPSADYAAGLSSGMLFKGAQTTVSGVSCYPIYMKA